MNKPNGAILYQGPSMLDGSPIVAIVTGLTRRSANAKTADMLQTFIIRTDVEPHKATKNGADSAICGACPMRQDEVGKRRCYVRVDQAPLSVFRAFQRGRYAPLEGSLAGRKLRIGSYGDPAAVPFEVWQNALVGTVGHTGYTHQWLRCDPRFASIVMASVDLPWQAEVATERGWRYFRVTNGEIASPSGVREIACPASKERGHITDCASCLACSGTSNPKRRFSVVIREH